MSDERSTNQFVRRHALILKLVIIGIILIVLLIPLFMVEYLIIEREERRDEAEKKIVKNWGGEQSIGGPLFIVPYVSGLTEGNAVFCPESVTVKGNLSSETLWRGIYEVSLNTGALDFEGTFRHPDVTLQEARGIRFLWDKAAAVIGLSDVMGVTQEIFFVFSGENKRLEPTRNRTGIFSVEVSAPVNLAQTGTDRRTLTFNGTLCLRGARSLSFLPLARETKVDISSNWVAPGFFGNFSPIERSVSGNGFQVAWNILPFQKNYPEKFIGEKSPTAMESERTAVLASQFGVKLITVNDNYDKAQRAIHYGILFLLIPLAAFFIFERVCKLDIHPFQYLIIGVSNCVFYLLLVALSEHLSFNPAYALSGSAVILLIGAYTTAVLGRFSRGTTASGIAGILYAFLFIVLNTEDYALLIGAVGLFLILVIVMLVTRNINRRRKDGTQVKSA